MNQYFCITLADIYKENDQFFVSALLSTLNVIDVSLYLDARKDLFRIVEL